MEITGSYYFEGAVYLIVLQLVIIAVLNIYSKFQPRVLLGLILLLYADAVRNSFLYNHLSPEGLRVVIGNLHLNFLFGPLLFLYIRSVERRLTRSLALSHLIIPWIYILSVLAVALLSFFNVADIGANIYLYETKLVFFLFYFGLTIKFLNSPEWHDIKFRKRYEQFVFLLSGFLIISLFDLLFWKYGNQLRQPLIQPLFYLNVGLYITISVFLIYHGLIHLSWFKDLFIPSMANQDHPENRSRTFDHIEIRLNEVIDRQKIYLNLNLTLPVLAKSIGVKDQQLSDYLIIRTGKNFSDFINAYRIKEFKRNVQRNDLNHLDLLGLAHESGFNSKATLNRVFKKQLGVTPRE